VIREAASVAPASPVSPIRPDSARAALQGGAMLGVFLVTVVVLAVAPGRAALASVDTAHSAIEVFLAGTCRDVASLLPACGALALVVLAAGVLGRRERAAADDARFRFRQFPGWILAAFPLLWLVSESAEEFRIQRGIDPTWFDFRLAWGDPAFISSSLHVFLYRRHAVPSVIALVLLALAWTGLRSLSRGLRATNPRFTLLGFAIAVAVSDGLALVPIDPHARLFQTLTDRSVVGQPFTTLFEPFGARPANVQLGLSSVIGHARVTPGDTPVGAALLGLPPPPQPSSPASACTPHPFARTFLTEGGAERALATGASPPHGARAASLLRALESLSLALFAGQGQAPLVLEVLLEGFRADDVHALNPNAAPEIAPFMSKLYESATNGGNGVLASRRTFQAGVRTAQALAALTCGLGTLPFGIALGRDLGPLPLRCLPDVLEDAGFGANFYYGARVSFDNMDSFLSLHGFSRIVGQWQLPRGLPAVYWGVTDRSLFDAVLAESTTFDARARLAILMTVTNHMPFSEPGDLPEAVRARVHAGLTGTRNGAGPDDLPRLLTLSYTDDAFEQFMTKFSASPLGSRSIVLALGDHSTSDRFVWPRADGARADTGDARSRIPFVLLFPEALVLASADPTKTREALRAVNAELDTVPISENDVPSLLLALLSNSAELRGLPPEARWHTLGGAVTSPWFAGAGGESTVLSGIDCGSEFFSLDAEGRRIGPSASAGPLEATGDLYTACPALQPVRSLLASFLNGYADKCRDPGMFRGTRSVTH
jgi:hypothetical protein